MSFHVGGIYSPLNSGFYANIPMFNVVFSVNLPELPFFADQALKSDSGSSMFRSTFNG